MRSASLLFSHLFIMWGSFTRTFLMFFKRLHVKSRVRAAAEEADGTRVHVTTRVCVRVCARFYRVFIQLARSLACVCSCRQWSVSWSELTQRGRTPRTNACTYGEFSSSSSFVSETQHTWRAAFTEILVWNGIDTWFWNKGEYDQKQGGILVRSFKNVTFIRETRPHTFKTR